MRCTARKVIGILLCVGSLSACGDSLPPDRIHPPDGPGPADASPADAADKGFTQRAYVKASNTGARDGFGHAVAMSADGSILVVGAPGEASAATGIGGDQADNSAADAGAVYVFVRSNGAWRQSAYIKPSTIGMGHKFGTTVALSADGSTLAVDDPNAGLFYPGYGKVYMFTRSGEAWTEVDARPYFNNFGDLTSLALSADGSILALGLVRDASGATGINGDQLDDSVPNSGAVRVFAREGTTWILQAYIKASNTGENDAFGTSVSLSNDGATLAVGAGGEGSAATGVDGDQTDNSFPGAGAVYVFVRSGATWSQQAYLKASNNHASHMYARTTFGASVALAGDGSTLAVGAPHYDIPSSNGGGSFEAGAVYVFARSGAAWSQQAFLHHPEYGGYGSGEQLGRCVALSGDGSTLAVSAFGDVGRFYRYDGAVVRYTRSDAMWSEQPRLKASNADENDYFGASVALSGDGSMMAVGASYEDGRSTGLGGDPADNSAQDAGAVYVFH